MPTEICSFTGVWYSLPLSKPRDELVSLVWRQFQGIMAMNDCSQWVLYLISVVAMVVLACSFGVFESSFSKNVLYFLF